MKKYDKNKIDTKKRKQEEFKMLPVMMKMENQ
jgi:hypothetical protein